MDTRIKDSIVMSAFYQAVGRERPNEGLIVHTEQGAQFTSQRFQALLLRYGCKQSMSIKGNPYDNAVMESFYRTLKRELVQDAIMTILNKSAWISLNTLKPTTILNGFILRWAGIIIFLI